MKRLNYIFLVLCCFNVSVSAQSLLIKDVTIISSNLPAPQSNMDVFIENGVIQQIAPIINNTADKTMNAQGRFLIPGLIDSHVHLGSNGGIREDLVSKHAQLLKQFQQQEPKSYLYFGFTTVVDLNQSENFVSNWESLAVKPDLIYCKALPLANGYGMAFLPENIRFQSPYFIYDENQKEDIPKNINLEEHSPNVVIKKSNQPKRVA